MGIARKPLFRASCASWVGALCLLSELGCATPNYQYGRFHQNPQDAPPIAIDIGKPNETLDAAAWVVETPERVVPFFPNLKKHQLSVETADKLAVYLQKNDLTDVHIGVNEYDPAGQWRRLKENTRISPAWRYTAGAMSVLTYTLFPGRVFGINRYNPYTNSLYVNADRPVVLLQEAAIAKDIHSRQLPGAYATVTSLPIFSLIPQARSISDVVTYTRLERDWETERQAYTVLYPRAGMETAMAAAMPAFSVVAWWGGPVFGLGGAAIGALAGQAMASRRDAEIHAGAATPIPANNEVKQATYVPEPGPK